MVFISLHDAGQAELVHTLQSAGFVDINGYLRLWGKIANPRTLQSRRNRHVHPPIRSRCSANKDQDRYYPRRYETQPHFARTLTNSPPLAALDLYGRILDSHA